MLPDGRFANDCAKVTSSGSSGKSGCALTLQVVLGRMVGKTLDNLIEIEVGARRLAAMADRHLV